MPLPTFDSSSNRTRVRLRTTVQALRSDNFNRADTTNAIGTPSDAGTAWVQGAGTWGISSNKGYESAGSSQAVAALEASAANVTVQATLSGAMSDAGLLARYADSGNYLLLAITPTTLFLYKVVASGFTQLASQAFTFASGDVFKFVVDSGNNLTGYQNGVSRITANDNAGATNTKHGIRANFDPNVRFDDFTIT